MVKLIRWLDFLTWYYQYPKLFVSVPNIRTNKILTKPYRKDIIIDVDEYIKFVDSTVHILSTKNNKPIFVPLSLRMSQHDIRKLVSHYIKKEYYYYWFDFEGKPINEATLGRINYVLRNVKGSGYFKKIICYFTNMRREIISNPKSASSPASDVLSSIAGANIIGVNREPRRNIQEGAHMPPPEHKARILDLDSYYYVKTADKGMFSKVQYVPFNALRLEKEFVNQSNYFLKNGKLDKFLNKKDMLQDYKDGSILRELVSKGETPLLDSWF